MYNFWFAFSISLFAGLSTAVGGVVPFFTKKTNNTFLIFSLGLSAGVMVYVSCKCNFRLCQNPLDLSPRI